MSMSMTEDEQSKRRASIKEIMQDGTLTPLERRRSIQSLMDGRRQSSGGGGNHTNNSFPLDIVGNMTMIAAAAATAADFYDSDNDSMPHTALSNHSYGYNSSNDNDDHSASSHSSGGGDNQSIRSTRSTRSGSSSRTGSRRGSVQSYPRASRSASLKAFANSTAAAAAVVAAHFHIGEDPEDGLQAATRMEKSRPECDHYDRQCSIISPCCRICFGCRICHDECPILPPPYIDFDPHPQQQDQSQDDHWDDEKKVDASQKKTRVIQRKSLSTSFTEEDTHHLIKRFAISEVICRQCYTRQCAKT